MAALAAQTLPAEDWELVVVDNASRPALLPEDLAPIPVPLRIVREEQQGIAYARFAGIAAARHELIAFVDDDNVLDPDYLAHAAMFLTANTHVGAVGGCITPEFETVPEPWAREHAGLLAVRDLGPETVVSSWSEGSDSYPWCAPYGAGVVIRATCARAYRDYACGSGDFDVGRVGVKTLGACEDAEMLLRGVLKAGLQVAYCPAMRLLHLIPSRRVEFAYLRRLAYESGVVWGKFCVRHGFAKRIPPWTVPLRQARAFLRLKAWTLAGRLAWSVEAGRFAGRGAPRSVLD